MVASLIANKVDEFLNRRSLIARKSFDIVNEEQTVVQLVEFELGFQERVNANAPNVDGATAGQAGV